MFTELLPGNALIKSVTILYSNTQEDANNKDSVFVLTDYPVNQLISSLVN
jgi:hypothetical protein